MRTFNGFRFSLQFKTLSDAHRQVGEFLERLGNKKSEAVVTALTEYLRTHPEALDKDNPVQVMAVYGVSEETLHAMIKAHVCKAVIGKSPEVPNNDSSNPFDTPSADHDTSALDVLLGGLDRFD